MAKTDNLSDFLTDVANSIRTKTGTSDQINAQDFSDKILAMTGLQLWWSTKGTSAYLLAGYDGTTLDGVLTPDETKDMTYMGNMFTACPNLITIPQLNTSKVTNMAYMFADCSSLTSIPLIDTSKVTNMRYMFLRCPKFTTLPQLDTSNVTNMDGMFQNCESLETIPLLDTNKLTTMYHTFEFCSKLKNVPLFDMSNCKHLMRTFSECHSLTTVPKFDWTNLTSISGLFWCCYNLTTTPGFITTNKLLVTSGMFYGCTRLTSVGLFNTSGVGDFRQMFAYCRSLETVPAFNFGNATVRKLGSGEWLNDGALEDIFKDCINLKSILITNIGSSLDISASTRYERSDLLVILNNLLQIPEGCPYTITLTMGATNLAKLTEEDKAIATNKGWTLA